MIEVETIVLDSNKGQIHDVFAKELNAEEENEISANQLKKFNEFGPPHHRLVTITIK